LHGKGRVVSEATTPSFTMGALFCIPTSSEWLLASYHCWYLHFSHCSGWVCGGTLFWSILKHANHLDQSRISEHLVTPTTPTIKSPLLQGSAGHYMIQPCPARQVTSLPSPRPLVSSTAASFQFPGQCGFLPTSEPCPRTAQPLHLGGPLSLLHDQHRETAS
jgi:hypothetical protein